MGYNYTGFGGMDDMNHSPANSPRDKHKGHKKRINSNDNDNDFQYRKFSGFGYDEEEKEMEEEEDTKRAITTENNQYNEQSSGHKRSIDEPEIEEDLAIRTSVKNEVLEQGRPKRKRRASSEDMAIISEEIITFKSWCTAFWEVMNVMDVCNDAKQNLVTPATSMISEMGQKQTSYDEYNDAEDDIDHVQQAIQDGNIMTLDGSTIKRQKRNNKNMLNRTLLLDETNISLSTKEKRKNEYIKDSKQMNIELLTVSSS